MLGSPMMKHVIDEEHDRHMPAQHQNNANRKVELPGVRPGWLARGGPPKNADGGSAMRCLEGIIVPVSARPWLGQLRDA